MERIKEYVDEKEELKKKLEDLEKATEEERERVNKKIIELEAKIEEKTKQSFRPFSYDKCVIS